MAGDGRGAGVVGVGAVLVDVGSSVDVGSAVDVGSPVDVGSAVAVGSPVDADLREGRLVGFTAAAVSTVVVDSTAVEVEDSTAAEVEDSTVAAVDTVAVADTGNRRPIRSSLNPIAKRTAGSGRCQPFRFCQGTLC